jgi:hypothetical protein
MMNFLMRRDVTWVVWLTFAFAFWVMVLGWWFGGE